MPVSASGDAKGNDDGERTRPSKGRLTKVRHVLSSSGPDDVTMSLGTATHRIT
jgi:hypothetical protein